MTFSEFLEQMFPFIHYCVRKSKMLRRANSDWILACPQFAKYDTLLEEQLRKRLEEERVRASQLDEKTFKLSLALSFGITVLSSIAALLVKEVAIAETKFVLSLMIALGVFYVLAAGFIALGALRTLPTYGYGTQLILQAQAIPNILADALARQETMNIVRHLRNETSYQALRNGLILIFGAFFVFAGALLYNEICDHAA